MSHGNKEWCKIEEITDLSFLNWHDEFVKFWPEYSKVLRICALMGSFRSKYIMFKLKKYRGVMFDDIEGWCKAWRKTDLRFQKWLEEFGKFSFTIWKIAI